MKNTLLLIVALTTPNVFAKPVSTDGYTPPKNVITACPGIARARQVTKTYIIMPSRKIDVTIDHAPIMRSESEILADQVFSRIFPPVGPDDTDEPASITRDVVIDVARQTANELHICVRRIY